MDGRTHTFSAVWKFFDLIKTSFLRRNGENILCDLYKTVTF